MSLPAPLSCSSSFSIIRNTSAPPMASAISNLHSTSFRPRDRYSKNCKVDGIRWKNETQRSIFSSKFLQALRILRRSPPRMSSSPGWLVRVASDRALAVIAKGRTRWSRAILSRCSTSSRLLGPKKIRMMRRKMATKKNASGPPSSRPRTLETRVRALGKLVPGCRKLSLPVLLEEASDYVAALEMQVRAMIDLEQQLLLSSRVGSVANEATTYRLSSGGGDAAAT